VTPSFGHEKNFSADKIMAGTSRSDPIYGIYLFENARQPGIGVLVDPGFVSILLMAESQND